MRNTSLLVLVCLVLVGCQKPEVADESKSAQPEAPKEGFAQEYESWKAKAVKEFPDLGKAGTPMNTRFLEAAKELSERKGEELKYPNWPYLLAVKVHSNLSAASTLAPSGAQPTNRPAAPQPAPAAAPSGPQEVGRVYSVADLKTLGALPSAASVTGRITKLDEIGLPPGVLMVVLDDALKCELTMIENASFDGLSWQRNGSTLSLVRQVGRGATAPVVALSMGQLIRVEGVFAQKRGSPVLVGTVRRD